jgi:hypothetical protein
MMKRTHEAFSAVWWLGGTAIVNGITCMESHSLGVAPAVVVIGVAIARPLSAGNNSPDMDHLWWPGPPKRGYPLRSHRGITHRVWFASLITTIWLLMTVGALYKVLGHIPYPAYLIPLFFAPLDGWWSHLAGDMIYGRILILGKPRGLGWETGGLSEDGGAWLRHPAAKVCLGLACALLALNALIVVHALA